MDNSIDLQNPEDIANEKAAVTMLLEAAAEAMKDAAPAPEPIGDITDLQALFEKQKQIGNELTALKSREADLTRQLQSIRDEAAELARQSEAVKVKAANLFETLFGRPERPAPRQILPAKPEVLVEPTVKGTSDYTRIPSLSL